MKIYMVSLLHRATINRMKIYMVSLFHRATIKEERRKEEQTTA